MAANGGELEPRPDPDNPGWLEWSTTDPDRFNSVVMGKLIVRREGEQCRLRMFPERRHSNIQGNIHGGVTLALIDIALFVALHLNAHGNAVTSVTLELSTQFVGAGDPARPLDAVTEVVRETGKLLFVRGLVEQEAHKVAAFSGIVRKLSREA